MVELPATAVERSVPMPAAPWRGGLTVLVVIAEPVVRELLTSQLRSVGCYPMPVASLDDGRRLASQVVPELVVLDLDIGPDAAGWAEQVLASQVHLALLVSDAAPGPEHDAVPAPAGGGACRLYFRKPFEPNDLVQRLLRLLRPSRGAASRGRQRSPLKAGGIELDRGQPTVRLRLGERWQSLDLPGNEHRLLAFLLADVERARSRQEILQAVWPHGAVDLRTVDQCVRRLRQSLGRLGAAALVKTVNGVGYRLQMEALSRPPSPR